MNLPRVAFDASLWDERTTGIGLYGRELARAMEAMGVPLTLVGARRSGQVPRGPRTGRTAFAIGQLPGVLHRLDVSLFHAINNFNLPLTRSPGKAYVLTVHDLIPELFPDTVSRAFRWQFHLWISRSLHVADAVVCVSEATKDALVTRHGVDSSRVTVTPLGVDHVDRVPPPDGAGRAFLRGLNLPPRYLLYAGSLDARKNVGLLLDALERLQARGERIPLVLLGQRWFGSAPVERRLEGLTAAGVDVRPLGFQPDPVFYEVVRRAHVFVFPSRYEGFGLPPLEAMRLGVPAVVTREAGALTEVCGDGALNVPLDAPDALATAIHRLWSDEREHARWAAAGKTRAAKFLWRDTANKTVEVYEAAIHRSHTRSG